MSNPPELPFTTQHPIPPATPAAFDRMAARDEAIRAVLPLVPEFGWTHAALRLAAGPEADLWFPGGRAELVAAYIDLADRDMVAASMPELAAQKLSARVRTLIATRLAQAEPHKAAVRRGLRILASPANARIAARCTARTVDAIWYAAGDTSADISWYTKRAILAGVYSSTLLYWLDDHWDLSSTLEFLDRRLAGVASLGKLRKRLTERFAA